MHKVKLKIFSFFQKCRNYLVIFGLTLCIFVFFFSFPASATSFVPDTPTDGLTVISADDGTTTIVRPYQTGSTFKYTWRFTHAGYYNLSLWYSMPSAFSGYSGYLSCDFAKSTEVGGLVYGQTVQLVCNDGANLFTPSFESNQTIDGRSMDVFEFEQNFVTFNSLGFGFYLEIYIANVNSSSMPLVLTTSFDFIPTSGPFPDSPANEDLYPVPDDSTTSQFDSLESDLSDYSSDSISSGSSWLQSYSNLITDWNLSSLSAVTKFFNYLTGLQSMNGHYYSTFDYFMRPIYISLTLMVVPLIIGVGIRFLSNRKRR